MEALQLLARWCPQFLCFLELFGISEVSGLPRHTVLVVPLALAGLPQVHQVFFLDGHLESTQWALVIRVEVILHIVRHLRELRIFTLFTGTLYTPATVRLKRFDLLFVSELWVHRTCYILNLSGSNVIVIFTGTRAGLFSNYDILYCVRVYY